MAVGEPQEDRTAPGTPQILPLYRLQKNLHRRKKSWDKSLPMNV